MRVGKRLVSRLALAPPALLLLALGGQASAGAEPVAGETAAQAPAAEAPAEGQAAADEPVILKVADYRYPYTGKLEVEIDPKGYTEFVYGIIERRRNTEAFAVRDLEWAPVSRTLSLDFSPRRFRHWVLDIALRDPDREERPKVVSKEFSVELPPWHADGAPKAFTVEAGGIECLHSEDNEWMQEVKTIVAFTLRLRDLPAALDRSTFVGFLASAPRIRYRWHDAEHVAAGVGRGMARAFDEPLQFGANYNLEKNPYPSCKDLAPSLAADWTAAEVRLVDKYLFPVETSAGTVVVPPADTGEDETGEGVELGKADASRVE